MQQQRIRKRRYCYPCKNWYNNDAIWVHLKSSRHLRNSQQWQKEREDELKDRPFGPLLEDIHTTDITSSRPKVYKKYKTSNVSNEIDICESNNNDQSSVENENKFTILEELFENQLDNDDETDDDCTFDEEERYSTDEEDEVISLYQSWESLIIPKRNLQLNYENQSFNLINNIKCPFQTNEDNCLVSPVGYYQRNRCFDWDGPFTLVIPRNYCSVHKKFSIFSKEFTKELIKQNIKSEITYICFGKTIITLKLLNKVMDLFNKVAIFENMI